MVSRTGRGRAQIGRGAADMAFDGRSCSIGELGRKHFASGDDMAADDTAHAGQERLAFAAANADGPAPAVRLLDALPAPVPPDSQSRVSDTSLSGVPASEMPAAIAGVPAAAGGHGRSALRAVGRAALPALVAEGERGTAFLLVPVLFGSGAATNFVLAREPSMPLLAAVALLSAAGVLAAGQRTIPRLAMSAILVFMLGMLAASLETWRAGTVMLGADISTRVTGRVVAIEERSQARPRLTIDVTATERPRLRYAPDRIRVTAREIPPGIAAGQTVAGVVRLLPSTGPVRPDSYDFSFESYFDGVGASGFFLSGPFPVEADGQASRFARLAAWVQNAREALADRIRSRIGGAEGEIAAALVAGVRSGIPEEDNEALRRTGLYHMISISGLHMALVAGTVLGGLRMMLALFPNFASRFPVKKFAAVAALAAISVYLLISGAEVAAQRSFIMFAVMLLAVLFDRAALTMRNLAIAAMIVLAIAPHEIMGPSFQMSFSATAALIGGYAWFAERRRQRQPDHGWREHGWVRRGFRMTLLFFGGLAMTSVIAGTASGLYGAWHFQRVAPLGLVANLAAMPLVTVAVMPMAVIGTVLIPVGLDGPFFVIMGKALAGVMAIAKWLAERSPIDEVGLMPPAAVVVLTMALAILTIATTRLRLLAVPLLVVGAALIAMREVPHVLVSEDGRLVAMRMSDGRLAVNRARPSSFAIENWTKALRASAVARPAPGEAEGAAEHPFACLDGACSARHAGGALVVFASAPQAAMPACAHAALIVIDDATAQDVCAGMSARVITKRDLARRGSAAVTFAADGSVGSVRFSIGESQRPWHAQRRFSREARGMPPYQRRPRPETKPAGETRPAQEGEESADGGAGVSSGG